MPGRFIQSQQSFKYLITTCVFDLRVGISDAASALHRSQQVARVLSDRRLA